MKKTEVILIRHGETVANAQEIIQGQTDTMLNETGERQAERIAERLRDLPFDALYASDLSRAMRTAEAIARPHGCPVIPCPELREWSLGAWEGKTISEVTAQYPGEFEGFVRDSLDMVVTGGESRHALQRRVSDILDALAQRHPGGRIVVVTHGGALGLMFKHFLNAEEIPFPHRPRTDNASYSKAVYFEDGTWQLVCWNDVSHLKGLVNDGGKW